MITEAAYKGPDGFYGFDSTAVLAATVNAVKEKDAQITELQATVTTQAQQIAELQAAVKAILAGEKPEELTLANPVTFTVSTAGASPPTVTKFSRINTELDRVGDVVSLDGGVQ